MPSVYRRGDRRRGTAPPAGVVTRAAASARVRVPLGERAHHGDVGRQPVHVQPLARAAQRSQTEFLAAVADLVGEQDARRYAALLISSANGIAGLEASGQLTDPKWGGITAEDLTDTLVDMIAAEGRHA